MLQSYDDSEVEEVDIDAQVEAAKKLLKNIRMRNQSDGTAGGAIGGETAEANEEMKATTTQQKFNQTGPMIDDTDEAKYMDNQMIGHSPSFKTVSRRKLDLIKGSRPKYEMDFQNSVYRYNVKHIDKRVTGKVVFDSPTV